MRFPWPARQYERTCADCGHSWRVPPEFARKNLIPIHTATFRIRSFSYPGVDPTELEAATRLAEEASEFRVCPECGSAHYSQHRAR